MLTDAVIQAIAAQIQTGYTNASSTCVVYSYWPSPIGLPNGAATPWLVVTEGPTETDDVVADGLRGGNDTLLCRYQLPGVIDQPGSPTLQALQQTKRADKFLLGSFFAQGIKANVGGLVIEAARTMRISNPMGGPYDAQVKTRVQLTWQAIVSVRTSLHT